MAREALEGKLGPASLGVSFACIERLMQCQAGVGSGVPRALIAQHPRLRARFADANGEGEAERQLAASCAHCPAGEAEGEPQLIDEISSSSGTSR